MRVYTVHEAPGRQADRIERAERLQFVGDGFDWTAAVFAPFALLAGGLYVAFAIYAVAIAVIVAILLACDISREGIGLAIAAVHAVVGFEYGELRRRHLEGAGWSDVGIVTGVRRAVCERRFFEVWLPRQPILLSKHDAEVDALATRASAGTAVVPPVPQSTDVRWRDWLTGDR